METLTEELLKQALWLDRLQGDTKDIIIARLQKAEKQIEKAINSTTKLSEKQRFIKLNQTILEVMKGVYVDYDALLFKDMEEVAEVAYNATSNLLNATAVTLGATKAVEYTKLSESASKRILDKNRPILGSTLSQIKVDTITNSVSRLRRTISQGLTEDMSLPAIQRNVRAVENANNLFGKLMRHELTAITNTALKSAIEESKGEVYRQHSDIITGWRSLGTLDNRTSDICRTLDNKFYSAKKYTWDTVPNKPPRHPNCRSLILPVTRLSEYVESDRPSSLQKGRTVNHRDGSKSTKFKTTNAKQVDATLTFNQWFPTTSKEFQREYLGKTRYELYQKDPRVLTQMYSLTKNKRLTIPELKATLRL